MLWKYNDGGRAEAGFKGDTGDCVCRAIAIATGLPYRHVYASINAYASQERRAKGKRSSARNVVWRATYQRYLEDLGWKWVPTMKIGSGTTVHLNGREVPVVGKIIVRLSRHVSAVIDGVIQDTHDPSREGTRAVYGYFYKPAA